MIVIDQGGECDCKTPEELLEKLSPRHPFWNDEPTNWAFRGQEKDWPLLPKAYRNKGRHFKEFGLEFNGLTYAPLDLAHRPSVMYDSLIHILLEKFKARIDHAGLAVPMPGPRLMEWNGILDKFGELSREATPLMALAQHFRLPTPLLDWSTRPYAAAYFALPGEGSTKSKMIVVWALQYFAIEYSPPDETRLDPEEAHMLIERAPRATNPNLHAQSGLFTYIKGRDAYRHTVDGYMSKTATEVPKFLTENAYPLMRKLTMPASGIPKLRRLLADEGIDGASMYPGYDGVVKAMRERQFWDRR